MKGASITSFRDRIASAVALHLAALAALVLIFAGLVILLGINWNAAGRGAAREATTEKIRLDALTAANAPLRGLDGRVAGTRSQIDEFLAQRIPSNYSAIATRLGELGVRSGVRLSQVEYSPGTQGTGLSEIVVDSGLSGEYPQIMRFVNGLERDRMFFVIRTMTLNGQQGGLVSLRLRFSTWLRRDDAMALGTPGAISSTFVPSASAEGKKE